MNIRDRFALAAALLAAGAIGGLTSVVATSFADNDNSTSTITDEGVIPYSGFVSKNSAPLDAQNQEMKFAVENEAGTVLWEESQEVAIYNGKFSVAIGTGTKLSGRESSLKQAILDAEALYIAIEIKDDASGNFVALSGRQRVDAAPFAMWSDNAATMKVEDRIIIQGDDLELGRRADARGGGGRALVAYHSNELFINFDGDFTSAVIDSNARIEGDAALKGTATVDGEAIFNQVLTARSTSRFEDTVTVAGSDLEITGATRGLVLDDGDIEGADIIMGENDLRFFGGPPSTGNAHLYISDSGRIETASSSLVDIRGPLEGTTGDFSSDLVAQGASYGNQPSPCPGNDIASVTNGSARICAYRSPGSMNYGSAVEQCWDDHGALLCTYQQMYILRDRNPTNTDLTYDSHWLADRTADDTAVSTNTAAGIGNFDDETAYNTNLVGAYCCRMANGR